MLVSRNRGLYALALKVTATPLRALICLPCIQLGFDIVMIQNIPRILIRESMLPEGRIDTALVFMIMLNSLISSPFVTRMLPLHMSVPQISPRERDIAIVTMVYAPSCMPCRMSLEILMAGEPLLTDVAFEWLVRRHGGIGDCEGHGGGVP